MVYSLTWDTFHDPDIFEEHNTEENKKYTNLFLRIDKKTTVTTLKYFNR